MNDQNTVVIGIKVFSGFNQEEYSTRSMFDMIGERYQKQTRDKKLFISLLTSDNEKAQALFNKLLGMCESKSALIEDLWSMVYSEAKPVRMALATFLRGQK